MLQDSDVRTFRGGKGSGGGGGSAPQSAPNTLRSKDSVEVILAIGEGPNKGLVDGAKSFYIADTPLVNANGNANFPDFELKEYLGDEYPNYEIISKLGGFASSHTVNVNITELPVTRQGEVIQITHLEVRMLFQRLYEQANNGSLQPTEFEFRIEYKAASEATWKRPFGDSIKLNDKTTTVYAKDYRWQVARINEPYEIRVTRLSPLSDTTYFADVLWESFQEVLNEPKTFPGTHVVQLVGQASDQFSSIPDFWGIYDGRIVAVPTNYDPETRTYTGLWDGTFKIAWTNNPAWIVYDLVKNDRYGMNAYRPVNLNKWDCYEAAQWCDEMVSDGKGGTQPRYTMNIAIVDVDDGREVIAMIAGAFNARLFDDLNGQTHLRVDKDEDAVALFTKENTVDGFDYSFSDVTTRYNDFSVRFLNEDLLYVEDQRRVFDQDDIDLNGRIPFDYVAVGCTNASEAVRRTKYKLITSLTETQSVYFKTNRKGAYINPWQIILIADPDMGYALSGRIKAISDDRKSITLRDPLYLETGVDYTLKIQVPGGLEERPLLSPLPGYNFTLEFDTPLPSTIPDRAVFEVEQQGAGVGAPKPFRVISVDEMDGHPDVYEIRAVEVNRNKWFLADNPSISEITEPEYSFLPDPTQVPGPESVSFIERFDKPTKSFHLVVNPILNRNIFKSYNGEFEVWSRPIVNGQPKGQYVKRDLSGGDTIINHPPGLHQFKILPRTYLGMKADIRTVSAFNFEVTNPKDPPPDVPTIRLSGGIVSWTYPEQPLDFAGFLIRYRLTTAGGWKQGIPAHDGFVSSSQFDTRALPPSAKSIMVKAVDAFGNESENEITLLIDLGDPEVLNVVWEEDFAALGFDTGVTTNGSRTAGSVVGTDEFGRTLYTGAVLSADDAGGAFYPEDDNLPMYPDDPDADFYQSVFLPMTFVAPFTVTVAGTAKLFHGIEGSSFTIEYRPVGGVYAPMPATFEITPGDYEIKVEIAGGSVQGVITELRVWIDYPDLTEEFEDFVVSNSGSRLPITNTYTKIKTVRLTLQQDGNGGHSVQIVDKNNTLGPLIKIYDKDGVAVQGLVDAEIKGY